LRVEMSRDVSRLEQTISEQGRVIHNLRSALMRHGIELPV
jgi:hypothetical protein